MFNVNHYSLDEIRKLSPGDGYNHDYRLAAEARRLYSNARIKGMLRRAWGALARRPNCLMNLGAFAAHLGAGAGHDIGTHAVPLSQILGSEGRLNDFDRYFHPHRMHNQQRWLGVAMARLQGVTLPPVELIQVGDIYFVRDGHHRVSVAQALGEMDIDAEVHVWRSQRTATEAQMATACTRMPQPA